jgi:hypothetical protein
MPNTNAPTHTQAEYDALVARLAIAEAAAAAKTQLHFKIAEKTGACSVIGLGKWPTTLYFEQWMRLLDAADRLREFLIANKGNMTMKSDKKAN